MSAQKHTLHQLRFQFFPHLLIKHARTLAEDIFFCRSAPIAHAINRCTLQLMVAQLLSANESKVHTHNAHSLRSIV